jgi:hypothetical protein
MPTAGSLSAANYTFAPFVDGTLTISPAALTVASGLAANNKIYDRTTTASLSSNNVALSTVFNGDLVSLNTNNYTANFASAKLGNSIAVIVTGLTLTGARATNYTLTQPAGLTASIVAPGMQIFANLPNIVISWTTNATVFGLNHAASLAPPVTWSPVTNTIAVSGTNNTVTIDARASGNYYFELIAAP